MIYRIQNPYDHTATTEINTSTNQAWHYYKGADRIRSLHSATWWVYHHPPPIDPDLLVDEGL